MTVTTCSDLNCDRCVCALQQYALLHLGGAYKFSPDMSELIIDTGNACLGVITLDRNKAHGARHKSEYDYHW
jgi:hypothetical protein